MNKVIQDFVEVTMFVLSGVVGRLNSANSKQGVERNFKCGDVNPYTLKYFSFVTVLGNLGK